MIQDESGSPIQQLGQAQQPQQQPPPNSLANLTPSSQPQQTQITKNQVIAGLHHFNQVIKQLSPILKAPETGKSNIRGKIFDASANLVGEGIATVPEIMNGIKDLPSDPVGQKKWLEKTLTTAMMAEKKLVSAYIAQGPGPEPQEPAWNADSHKDHMAGLMAGIKR